MSREFRAGEPAKLENKNDILTGSRIRGNL